MVLQKDLIVKVEFTTAHMHLLAVAFNVLMSADVSKLIRVHHLAPPAVGIILCV